MQQITYIWYETFDKAAILVHHHVKGLQTLNKFITSCMSGLSLSLHNMRKTCDVQYQWSKLKWLFEHKINNASFSFSLQQLRNTAFFFFSGGTESPHFVASVFESKVKIWSLQQWVNCSEAVAQDRPSTHSNIRQQPRLQKALLLSKLLNPENSPPPQLGRTHTQ